MRMGMISLSANDVYSRKKPLTAYAQFIQGSRPLKLTFPLSTRLTSSLNNTPLFFHNGLVGSMVSDRTATCREGMVNEIRRRHNLGNNMGLRTITIIKVTGAIPTYIKAPQLKNFIRAFVDKRENKAEFMHSLTSVRKTGKNWSITFPISDAYYGDSYTSASMLVWFLRNPQYIVNTKYNFDNLAKVLERLKKGYLNGGLATSTQNLILWFSLYVASQNGNVVLQPQNIDNPSVGASGPVNYITGMNLKQTMQGLLYFPKGIDALYKLTDKFSEKLLGQLSCYGDLLSYKKYLQKQKGA